MASSDLMDYRRAQLLADQEYIQRRMVREQQAAISNPMLGALGGAINMPQGPIPDDRNRGYMEPPKPKPKPKLSFRQQLQKETDEWLASVRK